VVTACVSPVPTYESGKLYADDLLLTDHKDVVQLTLREYNDNQEVVKSKPVMINLQTLEYRKPNLDTRTSSTNGTFSLQYNSSCGGYVTYKDNPSKQPLNIASFTQNQLSRIAIDNHNQVAYILHENTSFATYYINRYEYTNGTLQNQQIVIDSGELFFYFTSGRSVWLPSLLALSIFMLLAFLKSDYLRHLRERYRPVEQISRDGPDELK